MRMFLKRKIIVSALVALAILNLDINIHAAEYSEGSSCEVVILLDTSGSMNASDPDTGGARISTEAAQSFAFLRPSYSDTFISLVAYNTSAKTVLEQTNVRTEVGMAKYKDRMTDIYKNHTDGFENWGPYCMTNIGEALEVANELLKNSTASKKAVLLFTDGNIQLRTPEENERSLQKSYDSRDTFAASAIPVYTVGLNYDGSVNKSFLEDLADSTGGKCIITDNASDLIQYFNDIYADLFETIQLVKPPMQIKPHEEQTYELNIYGEAVKEVNVILNSDSPIENIKVLTPTGIDISANKEMCMIDSSVKVANIKILDPMDGLWTIGFIGMSEGILRIGEMHLYDISLITDQGNKIELNFGEILSLTAYLRNNEKNINISSTNIYSDSDSYVQLYGLTNDDGERIGGILNETSNGFRYEIPFAKPGEYTLQFALYNAQILVESEIVGVTVKAPVLSMEATGGGQIVRGEGCSFQIGLFDAPTDGKLIAAPDFIKNAKGTLLAYLDGNILESLDFEANRLNANERIDIPYTPSRPGNYTFAASLQNGDFILESESINIEFLVSQIKNSFPKSVMHVISGKDDLATYDLNKYFSDSDGDPLKFSIIAGEGQSDEIKIELDSGNSVLTLSFLKKGQFSFEIVATDEFGAEIRHSVSISVKSFMDVVIIVSVAVALLVVLMVAAAMVALSMKKINKRFMLTFATAENDSENFSVTGSIRSMKSAKKNYHKPFVNLWDIAEEKIWFPDGVPVEFRQYCSEMILTGQVLGGKNRGFKILCKIKGEKDRIFNGNKTISFRFVEGNKSYLIKFSKFEL